MKTLSREGGKDCNSEAMLEFIHHVYPDKLVVDPVGKYTVC